ncbi:MAG: MBL fold metallo-hydrolase RNA specificity domain-containing protein, partial [Halieaceae bacterium]|nr:MBL fold metallo-hydrolase RNA specificity domain-containing protein [Halieaceae bacterium]
AGAALSRLAAGSHPAMELEAGDTLILSARVIPGNEDLVRRLLDRFREQGVRIVDADTVSSPVHASGHPCADELAAMYAWLRPRLAVPVHGEARHMRENARIARASGASLALTGSNGDLFYLAPEPGIRRRAAAVGRLQVNDDGRLEPVAQSPASAASPGDCPQHGARQRHKEARL